MVLNRKSMLRCLCLALAFALVLPVVANAAETTLIRRNADASSTVVAQMTEGTALNVVEEAGNFYKVDCYNMFGYIAKEQVGYSFSRGHYVRCVQESQTSEIAFYSYAEALELRHDILELAYSRLGTPYVYGGTGSYGFDCSGFTQYIYGQLGIAIPRTCDGQLGAGLIIPKESLRCGDLVLFQRTTSHRGISTHVGIYLGEGKLIHAGGKGITVVDLD